MMTPSPTASAHAKHTQNAGKPIISMIIIRMIAVGEWFRSSRLQSGFAVSTTYRHTQSTQIRKEYGTMVRLNKRKIKALKRELVRRNEQVGSWRILARELYRDEINHTTLSLFARTDFVPSSEKLLNVLGLISPPSPYRAMPRWFNRTPKALEWFNRKRAQIKSISDAAKAQRKEMMK